MAANRNMLLNDQNNQFQPAHGRIDTVDATNLNLIRGGTSSADINRNGDNYVYYCWHSVPGFSAIGSYNGSNNSNGPYIYCGFRPAFILAKAYKNAGTPWLIYDAARNSYNPLNTQLEPSSTGSEQSVTNNTFDFCSSGFKVRGTGGTATNSSDGIIYMAFAEHPFGGANVSPSPAR